MLSVNKEGKFNVIRISDNKSGLILLDQGLNNVAICQTNISRIDGEKGELYYRDVKIEELLDHDFLSVAYLLIYGNSTNTFSMDDFKNKVNEYYNSLDEIELMIDTMDLENLHPMNVLSICVNYLSALEGKYLSKDDLNNRICFIISQVMIITTYYAMKKLDGDDKSEIKNYSYGESFIKSLSHINSCKLSAEVLMSFMNTVLILHAEHGQNCSTFTVRNVASVKSDPYQAVVAGIAAFKGDWHGGASQRVGEMYDFILSNKLSAKDFVNWSLDSNKKIMGFGHRIYKTWDPRAKIMYTKLLDMDLGSDKLNHQKVLMTDLIQEVTSNEYFTSRNIHPNPDLLNCIFFSMFGVPSEMNTLMLTISRVVGWLAHYMEFSNQRLPIIRPRQLPL